MIRHKDSQIHGDVAQTGDGKYLCALHAGAQSMTVIDYLSSFSIAGKGADLSHDFTAIYDIKKNIPLSVKTPRSIAMVGNKAYIAGYFSDSIQSITVSSLSPDNEASYALGEGKPMNGFGRGEFNFSDANNCFQKWQSCFSCHPFGRPDALNWMLSQRVHPFSAM